ncbi:hypothetical protein GF325_16570 [Candidatus Bathyarchaeota archaeon]|nr:hypothetical protein [Candidatus Bathyarchaeota archaeon]
MNQSDHHARQVRLQEIIDGLKEKEKVQVLFICAGNICRSPYAEMYFEQIIAGTGSCLNDKIHVASGGFITNKEIHPFTKRALLERGVATARIDQFHPRRLKKENKIFLIEADIIIAPKKTHLDILLNKKYRHKAFLFSELLDDGFKDIEDPALIKEYSEYKKVLEMMDPYLEDFAKKLAKEIC